MMAYQGEGVNSAACVELSQLGVVGARRAREAVLAEGQDATLTFAQIGGLIGPADDHAVAQDVDAGIDVTSGTVLGPNLKQPIGAAANDVGAATGLGAPAAIDTRLQLEPALGLELRLGGSLAVCSLFGGFGLSSLVSFGSFGDLSFRASTVSW
jgi:hypothetical protein